MKAARWLAGNTGEDGKPRPLSVKELAERAPLPQNSISANRLEEIEQLKVTAPPMWLEKIADALGVPHEWFSAENPIAANQEALRNAAALLEPLLLAGAQAHRQEREREPSDTDEPGRHGPSVEGADG